mgnify:CR=1 FL=1
MYVDMEKEIAKYRDAVLTEVLGNAVYGVIPRGDDREELTASICHSCGEVLLSYMEEDKMNFEFALKVAESLAAFIVKHT